MLVANGAHDVMIHAYRQLRDVAAPTERQGRALQRRRTRILFQHHEDFAREVLECLR